jgi:hypothetical protein
MPKDHISELDISECVRALRQCRGVTLPVITGTDIILQRPDFAKLCDFCDEDMIVGACKTYRGKTALLAVCDPILCRATVYHATLSWHLHAAGLDPTLHPPRPIIARDVPELSMDALEHLLDLAFEVHRTKSCL